ncbi:MAG: glycosyltransferase family 39 protein [Candidatus Kerfeldbacteria bacterium]
MSKISSKTKLLIIIFVFLIIKQIIFVFAVPAWNNHDEPAHFHYTQYIVEEKKLPLNEIPITSRGLSFSEAYAESEIITDSTRIMRGPNEQFRFLNQRFDEQYSNFSTIKEALINKSGKYLSITDNRDEYNDIYYKLPQNNKFINSAAIYQPLYYILEAIPYTILGNQDIVTRLYAMRLFSNIFYILTLLVCYLIAMRISRNFKFSLTLLLLIGLLPVFSHLVAGVTNNTLLILIVTLLIYWSVRVFQNISTKNVIWLGIILGLGMLTKPEFIIFAFPTIIPFIYHLVFTKKCNIKLLLKYFLYILLLIIVISGWWHLWVYLQQGNIFLSYITLGESVSISIAQIIQFLISRWIYAFVSYGYAFGFATEMILPLYIIFCGVILSALSFFGYIYKTFFTKDKISSEKKAIGIYLISGLVFIELFFLYLFIKTLIAVGYARFPIDGRYYLPLVFNISFIFLLGIHYLLPKKIINLSYIILIVSLLIMNVISIWEIILLKFYL